MYLLDSGCDHTLVPQSLVERLRNLSVRPTNRRLRGVQDIELDIIGKVTLPMELGGRTTPTEALVSPVYRPWRRPAHRSRPPIHSTLDCRLGQTSLIGSSACCAYTLCLELGMQRV